MDEHTRRRNETSRIIGEDASRDQLEAQQRQQESKLREDNAKIAYQVINERGFGLKDLTTNIDVGYQYELGKELEDSNNKPLNPQTTDVEISKKLFKATEGQHYDKIRDAIRNHSSIAARVPKQKRDEYANVAATKGYMEYKKDIPREEKTRVQTPHDPNTRDLTEEEMLIFLKKNDGNY